VDKWDESQRERIEGSSLVRSSTSSDFSHPSFSPSSSLQEEFAAQYLPSVVVTILAQDTQLDSSYIVVLQYLSNGGNVGLARFIRTHKEEATALYLVLTRLLADLGVDTSILVRSSLLALKS